MRVIMPAIIDQAGRPFNVDEADGISRRHRARSGHGVQRPPPTDSPPKSARQGQRLRPPSGDGNVVRGPGTGPD
jgi:hypothetical protein